MRILSRSDGFAIDERDWEPTAGSESGWLAAHPNDPDIVYGGNYGGYLDPAQSPHAGDRATSPSGPTIRSATARPT